MVKVERNRKVGEGFIPHEFLPDGSDQYDIRNSQKPDNSRHYRSLRPEERRRLEQNGNTAEEWDSVLVNNDFDPDCVRNSSFFGLVRIGRLDRAILEYHDLLIPAGIYNCCIIDCDIGDDVALRNLSYCAHYIIGSSSILTDIGELHVTNHAKFGNGTLKEGEPEEDRVWIDIMNETGKRRILPFDGMISADAYLWAKYRDDAPLMERLKKITQDSIDSRRGWYGTIGDHTVVKSSRILKDVKIGSHCYIKGANKLKNLTINSSEQEPSQIGEGVELVNGIIGYGCRVFYGCKAVRFVMGDNSALKYGARLINSCLGANSTISCCEVLNNLIFPAHEQHHNNSFLIASLVMGQSNMAAGATVGSNHNSRANDNELVAGRGFWPGLCTSLKHPSRFASYVLIAKGDYPAELDIPFPFSLVNNNESEGRLEIMPAYWWNYNMYALVRNARKYSARDKRIIRTQNIEFDFLAPDTAEEILTGMELLTEWTAAALERTGSNGREEAQRQALRILREELPADEGLKVYGENIERGRRPVLILKPAAAYRAYRQMLIYYAARNLLDRLESDQGKGTADSDLPRIRHWTNLGGQLVPAAEVDRLRHDISEGVLADWEAIHARYSSLWGEYPAQKQRHAMGMAQELRKRGAVTDSGDRELLKRGAEIQLFIRDQVFTSRNKDFENPFSLLNFRNQDEMTACRGSIEENEFILRIRQESEELVERFQLAIERG